MSNLNRSQKTAKQQALAEGFEVIESRRSRLLLDLDDFKDIVYFNANFEKIKNDLAERGLKVFKKDEWVSKSGQGQHVYLAFPRKGSTILNQEEKWSHNRRHLTVPERMLLEVCLGSDRKRAFLGFIRYLDGEVEPELLFKPKKKTDVKAE